MFVWADRVQRFSIFYHAVPGKLSAVSHLSRNLIFYHAVPVDNTIVTSIVRNTDHVQEVQKTGAIPLILSLETASVADLSEAFKNARPDVIYFSAGSGGAGGLERLKSVDEDGAIKVFDAIESLEGDAEKRPRLILLSSLDVRDPSKPHPAHYVRRPSHHSNRY